MQAIVDANALEDARSIFAGQSLLIPCGRDTGQSQVTATSTPAAASGVVDCSNFAALAPSGNVTGGSATFAWTPAAGAAAYRLNIYNQDLRGGVRVATLTTDAGSTSLLVDLSAQMIGEGYKFTWEMQALTSSSDAVCTSARVNLQRGTPPNPPTAAPPSTPETRPTKESPPPTEEPPPPTEETQPTAEVTPPDGRPQETPGTVPTEEPPNNPKPTEEPPPPDQPPSDPNPPEQPPPDNPPPTEEAPAA
jgi:hypothetical protein